MKRSGERRCGVSAMELMVGATILLVGVLGYVSTTLSSSSAVNATHERDDVRIVLENWAERLRSGEFGSLYRDYHQFEIPVSSLKSDDGRSARLSIQCFVDETDIPREFGSVKDLDGVPSERSRDVSMTYRLLPIRLELTYPRGEGERTAEIHLLVGPRGAPNRSA
ncbi:MAG: hypothetical protein AAF488_12870 [Planctomycetota bacterium]